MQTQTRKSLSHLVEFSDHLLREKLLQEVPVFKSIDGHNLCTASLPVIPGNERKTMREVGLRGTWRDPSIFPQTFPDWIKYVWFKISKQNNPKILNSTTWEKLPGSLIIVAGLPFVTLSIARIFTVLFSACRTRKKDKKKRHYSVFSSQSTQWA